MYCKNAMLYDFHSCINAIADQTESTEIFIFNRRGQYSLLLLPARLLKSDRKNLKQKAKGCWIK